MKKIIPLLFILIAVSTCKKEVAPLTFFEDNFTSEEFAVIEINIPKVENPSEVGEKINTTIETFVANAMSLNEDETEKASVKEAALKLDVEYQLFTEELLETAQPWEVFVDGELTYQSPEIVSIALLSSIYKGGAHGYSSIKFLNFNPTTGELYTTKDLINNIEKFSLLAKEHYKKAIKGKLNTDEFKFPETIGFSDDGVIMLYNYHETGMLNENTTEFTIPFEEANTFLNIN